MDVEVPYHFTPYEHAHPLIYALEGGIKRACVAWHRRASKSVNIHAAWTVPQCFKRPGSYWHVFPTYKQGRQVAWEESTQILDADGMPRKFRDFFPPQTIIRDRDDEMTLWLEGGAKWSVVGSDQVDRLVGANPVGVVFDEYSLQRTIVWDYLAPILVENKGWAVFVATPRGHNHFYSLLKKAEAQPERWFTQRLTVDQTKRHDGSRIVTDEDIENERKDGRAEEIIQQEYYCDFNVALQGSYFSQEMTRMLKEDRICTVRHNPNLLVHTAWDLGIADETAIWFFQIEHGQFRWLGCYHRSGEAAAHYAQELTRRSREGNWIYGEHLVPHDAKAREWGSGKTRIQTLRELGYRTRLVERSAFGDGIDQVRGVLARSIMDEEACKVGIQALREYTKKKSGREDEHGNEEFLEQPVKDWTSHLCDAMRTAACGIRPGMHNRAGQIIELPQRTKIAMA